MTDPFVSICIPSYNGERYIKECLESCIGQSFTNYEIVVCDDGSSDRTIEIIDSYAKTDPRIKLYRNDKNLGLVGNWNKCIELARGEWIKFVFQDDIITKDCLKEFVAEIKENVDLIVCKRNFLLENNRDQDAVNYYENVVRTLENTGHYQSKVFSPRVISKIAVQNILMNFIAEPSLTFFRKKVVDQIGYFSPELKQICDLEFFLRLASNNGLVYIPKHLCAFRIHAGSTTEKNIKSGSYHVHYLESLIFASRLKHDAAFQKFRTNLNFFELLKLKLYIKFRSYKAFSAIESEEDKRAFEKVKHRYGSTFFKPHEIPLMKALKLVKG